METNKFIVSAPVTTCGGFRVCTIVYLLHRHCITTVMVLYNQWNMTSLLTIEYSFIRSLRERIFDYSCSVFVSQLLTTFSSTLNMLLSIPLNPLNATGLCMPGTAHIFSKFSNSFSMPILKKLTLHDSKCHCNLEIISDCSLKRL